MCWDQPCESMVLASQESEPRMSKPRAHELGIPFEGTPGKKNAITDVAGVAVSHTMLAAGKGLVCTGITASWAQ